MKLIKRLLHFTLAITMVLTSMHFVKASEKALSDPDRTYITVSGVRDYNRANDMLKILNQERAKVGAQALTMNEKLMETAMLRAAEESVYWNADHERPNGETCFTAGPMSGENAAYGGSDAAGAMKGFMNSPGHKENLLRPVYKSVGIGVFNRNGMYYWVQNFDSDPANNYFTSGEYDHVEKIEFVTDKMKVYLDNSNDEEILLNSKTDLFVRVQGLNWISDPTYSSLVDLNNFSITISDPSIVSIDTTKREILGLKPGVATIKLTLKQAPYTQLTKKITVSKGDIAKAFLTNASFIHENFDYTGSPIEPIIELDYGSYQPIRLVEGKDYTVTYKNNEDINIRDYMIIGPRAEINVTGIGNFTGSIQYTFCIKEKDMYDIKMKGTRLYSSAFQLLDNINKKRSNLGMSALTMDKDLLEIAMTRSGEVNFYADSKNKPDGTSIEKYAPSVSADVYYIFDKLTDTAILDKSDVYDAKFNDKELKSIGIGWMKMNNRTCIVVYGSKQVASKENVKLDTDYQQMVKMKPQYMSITGNVTKNVLNGIGDSYQLLFYNRNRPLDIFSNVLQTPMEPSNFKFTSSDPSVISIDENGKYTAKGAGEAVITYVFRESPRICKYSFTVRVDGASITDATVSTISSSTYTGNAITPTPTITYQGTKLVKDKDYELTYSNNVNKGIATLTITGKGSYYGTMTRTFSINAAAMSVNAPAVSGVYNGNAYTIALNNVPAGSSVKYGTVAGSYTTTVKPVRTSVGKTTVYYQVTNANYNTYTGSTTIEVTTATMSIIASSYNSKYDGVSHTFIVSNMPTGSTIKYRTASTGSYTLTTKPTRTAVGTTTVYYQITNSNYKTYEGSATITIQENPMDVTATNYNGDYDGIAHGITLNNVPTGSSVLYRTSTSDAWSTTVPTRTEAGITTVYYQVTNSKYSNTASGSATITIKEKAMNIRVNAYQGVYDGISHKASFANVPTGSIFKYRTSITGTWTTIEPIRTAVGTTTVYYEISHPDYPTVSGQTSIIVTAASFSVNVTPYAQKYDGAYHTFTVGTMPTGSTIRYGTTAGSYTTSVKPTRKEVGKTTVYYQITNSNYTTYSGTTSIEILENLMNITVITYQGVYDGKEHGITLTNVPTGSTIQYRTSPTGTWSTIAPTITSGKMTVYYQVTNSKYSNIVSGSAEVEVKEAVLDIEEIPYIGVYDGQAHTFTLNNVPEGSTILYRINPRDQWKEEKPSLTEVGSVSVYYQVSNPRYSEVYYGVGYITITAPEMNVTAESYTGIYDGEGHTINLKNVPEGSSIRYRRTPTGTWFISSPQNKDVGIATVYYEITNPKYATVTGSATIEIKKRDLKTTSYGGVITTEFTGSVAEPTISISYLGKALVIGTDYTITYTNNSKPGKGTATLVGKGNYTGSITKEFSILPKAPELKDTGSVYTNQFYVYYNKIADTNKYEISYRVKGTQTWYSYETTGTTAFVKVASTGTYEVRVRSCYKTGDNLFYNSAWSNTIEKVVK